MEKFKLEIPTIERKFDSIEYIYEFLDYGSKINGVGGLNKQIDNYEGWLQKLEVDRKIIPNEKFVPAETYFLVREYDDKIVGMINIRLALNDNLRNIGGHIGYSIRPTERRKGYNKIILYLSLLVCQEHGIKEIYLDCIKSNLASSKTMLALGAELVKEWYENDIYKTYIQRYKIDVDKSIDEYKEIYEPFMAIKNITI